MSLLVGAPGSQLRVQRRVNRATFAQVVAEDGASHYWPFDEASGASAVDVLGELDMVHNGSPTVIDGLDGRARYYSGSGVWSQTSGQIDWDWSDGVVLEALVKIYNTNASTGEVIMGVGEPGNTFRFEHNANGEIRIVAGSSNYVASGLSVDTWYHVVAQFDGADAALYINGVEADSGTPSGISSDATSQVFIRRKPFNPPNNVVAVFAVDAPVIYPAVLSPAQILAHAEFFGLAA